MVDELSHNLLSNCQMSLNVSAWPKRLCESPRTSGPEPGDPVSDEPELPQRPYQTSGQENNVAPVSQPDVSMPDPGSPETLDESADTTRLMIVRTVPEPVPHSSSSLKEMATRARSASSRTWRSWDDATTNCLQKDLHLMTRRKRCDRND